MIVISMETAQQQAGRRRPIGARSGSRVSSNGRGRGGGCAGGLCGPVKVNAQGGVIRSASLPGWTENITMSVWRRDVCQMRSECLMSRKILLIKDQLTFEL